VISVFEQFAPKYKKVVRRFALTAWRWGSQSAEARAAESELYKKADTFRMRYERALKEYYREKEIRIWPGTIRAKGQEWLREQKSLTQAVKVVADAKKNKLAVDEFEKLRKESPGDIQKLLNKVYLSPEARKDGENVFGVFSFKDEMSKKAEQIGEEAAFDLGAKINDAVIGDLGDRYKWRTQEDKRVRKTHRKLNGKTFLWTNPPTTIDEYGNKHTGHCGSDYGCRCYSEPSKAKPLIDFVVVA
jgi:hypothetical protein